jgi:hypothetical protein
MQAAFIVRSFSPGGTHLHSHTVPHAFCCTQKSKRAQRQPAVPQENPAPGLCTASLWPHMHWYFSGRIRTQLQGGHGRV